MEVVESDPGRTVSSIPALYLEDGDSRMTSTAKDHYRVSHRIWLICKRTGIIKNISLT